MPDRNQEIVAALSAELGRRFYESHVEWMMSVFGGNNIVCAQWDEMKPEEKFPYIELGEMLLVDGHAERNHLLKRIDV